MDEYRNIHGWNVRVHIPPGNGPHPVILLLHGWTGDENSMWIFTSRLPSDAYWIAPRGMYTTPLGGYGWQDHHERKWSGVDDLRPAVERLLSELLRLENFPGADLARFSVIGFSQGAALAYTLAVLRPERISKLAGLAGFMPIEAETYLQNAPLDGLPVFVAHGSLDKLVPVEKARRAVEILQLGGGDVVYCEDEIGHKLGGNCFRGLGAFFSRV